MKDYQDKIMDYLYGEMDTQQRIEFEEEMHRNIELKDHVQSLQAVRENISVIQETEIPANWNPIVLPSKTSLWSWGVRLGSIAASIILLCLFLKVMDFQIVKSEKGITLSFGKIDNVVKTPSETNSEQHFEMLQSEIAALKKSIDADKSSVTGPTSGISSNDLDHKLNQFYLKLQDEQLKNQVAWSDKIKSEQGKYVRAMGTEILDILEERRYQDLKLMNDNFQNLAVMIQANYNPQVTAYQENVE